MVAARSLADAEPPDGAGAGPRLRHEPHARRTISPDPVNWHPSFLRPLAQIDPDGRTVRALRDRWSALLQHEADFPLAGALVTEADSNRPERQRPLILLDLLATFGPRSVAALPAARRLARESPDPDVQQSAQALIDQIVVEPPGRGAP